MGDHNLIIGGEMHLTGPVGFHGLAGEGFTVRDVTEALSNLTGDITVKINSGGGMAFDGIAIHSLLSQHDGKVTTVVHGIAASAASIIFMAGETRQMAQGAMLMIHDASGLTMGTEADHMKTAETLGKLSNNLAGIYAGRTGASVEAERATMREETWLDGPSAVDAGFATDNLDTGAATASSFDYGIYSHAPEFLVKTSKKSYEDPAALVAAVHQQPKEDDMAKAPEQSTGTVTPESEPLTLANLKADHPDIVDALVAETGTDAAKSERERIRECLAVLGAGEAGETVKALCFDGKSQPGDIALAVLAEARAKGSDHLASLAAAEAQMTQLKAAPVAQLQEVPDKATTPDGWKAEFEASTALQNDFLCAADYAAFKAAEAAGRVKMIHANERTA